MDPTELKPLTQAEALAHLAATGRRVVKANIDGTWVLALQEHPHKRLEGLMRERGIFLLSAQCRGFKDEAGNAFWQPGHCYLVVNR